ncbi:hypothetical protein MSAN_01922400 [Mycena sanguinolenta]|uniref:Uncharacterized protein n=1 Tax=Mycena sanguinolenta TaxID=230812 RepID=A0A8H7CQD9_9AGAR|nr:hypothetical protein MSAN_01922400 [Mycena sanguinolenta]
MPANHVHRFPARAQDLLRRTTFNLSTHQASKRPSCLETINLRQIVRKNRLIWSILCIVVTLCVLQFVGIVGRREEALDPVARDRKRQEWDREVKNHEAMRQAWSVELADHEAIRVGWEAERQEIITMREQLVHDKEEWVRHREDEKHEEERRRQEEEDRIRAGFAWDGLRGDQRCLQHGMRRYTAQLANVPREYDPVKACTETAIEIHGVKIPSPDRCEDRGCAGVFGHWIVNYSEPACVTHFDFFQEQRLHCAWIW